MLISIKEDKQAKAIMDFYLFMNYNFLKLCWSWHFFYTRRDALYFSVENFKRTLLLRTPYRFNAGSIYNVQVQYKLSTSEENFFYLAMDLILIYTLV